MGWQKEIKSMKTVNKAVKLSLFLCEKNGYENNPKNKKWTLRTVSFSKATLKWFN